MIEAQTDVVLGEAIRPAAKAHAKIIGRGNAATVVIPAILFAAGMVAGSLAGNWLARAAPRLEFVANLLWIPAAAVAMTAGLAVVARRQVGDFLAAAKRLGSPERIATRFRFDEAGITTETDRMSHRLPWPAVMFIIPHDAHWLVQVDTQTIAIPRRAFADTAAERAFLDLARAQLSDDARERSAFANQ